MRNIYVSLAGYITPVKIILRDEGVGIPGGEQFKPFSKLGVGGVFYFSIPKS